MCRIICFNGICTTCAGRFVWSDLSQELSCLDAKNVGLFGHCKRGVQTEEHAFDQECDGCAALAGQDEGYVDMEDELLLPPPKPASAPAGEQASRVGPDDNRSGSSANDHKGKNAATWRAGWGSGSGIDRGRPDQDGRRSKKQRTS